MKQNTNTTENISNNIFTAKGKSKAAAYAELWNKAHTAGMQAGNACIPTPMIVGTPTTVLGNDIDRTKPTYFVPSGVCGFAWVNVKDARSGFVKWLKSQNLGHKSYYGGFDIWVSEFGQSMQCKEAYARAVASVLRDAGIKCYANSRMD